MNGNVKENIKNLEEKLMQLNSLTNLKPELDTEIEKMEKIKQSFTNNNHSIHESLSNLSNHNKNQTNYENSELSIQPKKIKNTDSYTNSKNTYNHNNNNEIESYIEANDRLQEILREKDMKIETLNFRCEKLQSELTQNMNKINKLVLQGSELTSENGLITQQRDYLESLVEENKNTLLPEHQKLKSKYDICVLEIKSLENDNRILETKLRSYIEMNKTLKIENREINTKNSKMEIEKLEIKRDIEIIKSTIKKNEDDNKYLYEQNNDILIENERLKNQLVILKKKIKIFSDNKNFLSSYNIGNFDKLNEVSVQIPAKENNLKKSFLKKFEKNFFEENKKKNLREDFGKRNKGFKSRGDVEDDEGLNFDDLAYFEKDINKFIDK